MANATELDGRLIPHNRLLHLSAMEVLNWGLAQLFDGADGDSRKRIQAALEGRLGPGGGIIVDDPDLPASLQGMEAPSWWKDDQGTPTAADTISLS